MILLFPAIFLAAFPRATYAITIATDPIAAPAPRVAFGPVVKNPLASFVGAIFQPVRPVERQHFRERRRESRKYPRPARLQRQKFRTHSILALEQFLSHRYVQVRIQGRDISGLECSAELSFAAKSRKRERSANNFALGTGRGTCVAIFQRFRMRESQTGSLRWSVTLPYPSHSRVLARSSPGKLPPKARGGVIVLIPFDGHKLW